MGTIIHTDIFSKSVEDRTAYVRCMFYNYTLIDHLRCLGIALGFAFISSIVFPYLTILINWINRTSKKLDKREHKLKSQETKVNEKENIIHQLEIEDIKSGKKQIEDYNKSIEDLKKSYEDRIKSLNENYNTEIHNLKTTVNDQKQLIEKLDKQILSSSQTTPRFGSKPKRAVISDENFYALNIINLFSLDTIKFFLDNVTNGVFILPNSKIQISTEFNELLEYFNDNKLGVTDRTKLGQIITLRLTDVGVKTYEKIISHKIF